METNEKELDVDAEELEEPEEILAEDGTDTTDWKSEALKRHGIAKRYQTKLQKMKEVEKKAEAEKAKAEEEKAKQSQDKKDFDLAEKSYLISNGIKKEELKMVFDEVKKTGKTLDEILESKYFQETLKEKRELEASEKATPPTVKRAGGAAGDEVDYWLKKGEYPPNTPENRDLRRKVANALATKAADKTKFSDRPVV